MSSYYDFDTIAGYAIGEGTIGQIKRITFGMGEKYLVIGDRHLTPELRGAIEKSLSTPVDDQAPQGQNLIGRGMGLMDDLEHFEFQDHPLACEFETLKSGLCTRANAQELGSRINRSGADVVVAVGGSKVLDLCRAALHFCGAYVRPRLVMIPTVLNSNSCATSVSVMYDESGDMSDFWNLAFPVEQVIVDTGLLAKLPARQLAAGIGDQVSSSLEALHTMEARGGVDSYDPLAVAHHRAVLDVLESEGVEACKTAGTGKVTPAFEHVCHAVSQYTGPQLAVATSYLSHVLDEALIGIPELSRWMHGELVGYGVMPDLVASGHEDQVPRWAGFFRKIGVPVTLAELGIGGISRGELVAVCERAAGKVMASRAVKPFSPEQMADFMLGADRIVDQSLPDPSR